MRGYFNQYTSASPLAVFRIMLGGLIFLSMIRFWANGWIETLYIEPKYFFPFYGFEFVKPLGDYTYLLFIICAFAALLVMLGLFYRISMVVLFLSFTYIELMDKSTYLNHYYFVSMVCLLMIFLPAHICFSLDVWRQKENACARVPCWCVDALKLFAGLVYLYAGLAKVNSDWLLHAQPLRIWLPAKNDLVLIGPLLGKVWVAYAFSWAGCLYDLSIPFLLLNKRTRPWAYGGVIVFHTLTAMLFPIGMFPYIMMGTALIFFSPSFHDKIIHSARRIFQMKEKVEKPDKAYIYSSVSKSLIIGALAVFFFVQLALPWRYLLYPDELFWTEEGYRFSWRVMLMEKAGYAEFTVKDVDNRYVTVKNSDFLTPLQEKMMAAQPDMILHYAHLLRDYYTQQGFHEPQVYVDSYVTLNGRLGKTMIDPRADLTRFNESFNHKTWILPFNDDIKGF